ncbi:MAG: class I adenylate-forming enzyme family protein, partial [Burkholderiaceae bacterium]
QARRVAVLVYTSGTTGAPKAVMLTHRNLLFIGANGRALRALTPTDTVYGVLPLAHVYGLSSLLVATLGSGGTLHLAARFSPAGLADALARGVTVLHGVPAMYAKLLDAAKTGAIRLAAPRLRVAQSGGAPLSPSLKAAFEAAFGVTLHNGYGMTETAPSICQTRLEAPRADGAAGPPIPGIEIRLDSAAHGGDGVGELLVRGPNVMAGYYRTPEQTAAVLDADGWLRTGDLARIDPDGSVWIVGRRKELILRSGFNVYPAEVEEQLNAHPDIVQSAVVGRALEGNEEGNEEAVAFVELRAGAALDREALRAWLGARLVPDKVPGEIVAVAALPTAPNGKVRKHELQRLAAERAEP